MTLYDQMGEMHILGAIVGRGVPRSWLGAKVPNLRQKFPLWLGATQLSPEKVLSWENVRLDVNCQATPGHAYK